MPFDANEALSAATLLRWYERVARFAAIWTLGGHVMLPHHLRRRAVLRKRLARRCRRLAGTAGGVVMLLIVPFQGAVADVPDTVTLTTEMHGTCQLGDECENNLEVENDQRTMSARLVVQSNRAGRERSVQDFAARFTNTFTVPGGTRRITFTGTWNITALATAVGAARGGCNVTQSGDGFVHVHQLHRWGGLDPSSPAIDRPFDGSIERRFAFTETFRPRFELYRREITVFSEFSCSVSGTGISRVELDLQRAVFEHLHVSFER